MLFGGEGLFLTTLTGPGKVYLQTMNMAEFANKIIPYLPTPSSKQQIGIITKESGKNILPLLIFIWLNNYKS